MSAAADRKITEAELNDIISRIVEAEQQDQGFVVIMDLFGIHDWETASILVDQMKDPKSGSVSKDCVKDVLNKIICGDESHELYNSIFKSHEENKEKFMRFMISMIQSNGVIEFEPKIVKNYVKQSMNVSIQEQQRQFSGLCAAYRMRLESNLL